MPHNGGSTPPEPEDISDELTEAALFEYPPGSIGWLRGHGICCECGFASATRLMVDPACSPALVYCERCIDEINRYREEHDESTLEEACYECGGSGRYDDVLECHACDGSGVLEP